MIIQLQEKLARLLNYLEQDQTNSNLLLSVGLIKAQILHHQEKLEEAIILLEHLTIEHESSADVAGLLALLYVDHNQPFKADLFSRKALTLNAGNYEGLLVQTLLRTQQNEATLNEINTLIKINPEEARLWFALGSTQMRHMNLPAALDAFDQTTRIYPDFYDSWICCAWCHLLQNHLSKANMAYQKAVNIDAKTADGWGGLALICALQNNMSDANDYLQKAEELDRQCFLAMVTRIMIANQSNPEEAVNQFNRVFPDVAVEIRQIIQKYQGS